jgi:uncharacterized YccA/Bax inhibitor family protein
MANNPALNRFTKAIQTPSATQLESMYDQPAYIRPTRYMTLDDVVVRTVAMLGVLFAAGAVSWALTPSDAATPVLIVGAMGGLALGLFMAFTMRANALTSLLYAGFEGTFLGAISRIFEAHYKGIVVEALTGTIMVAAGVLFVYKIGAIRVTPKFTRMTIAFTFGAVGLMLVNFVAYLFHPGGLGLRDGGPMAIVFSLVCIAIAAMNLVLDFDMIEQGIKRGADQKFAWYASFALMVTLVWLYLEILRLLGYLRD